MGFNRRVCRVQFEPGLLKSLSDDALSKIFGTFVPIKWWRDNDPWDVLLWHPDFPRLEWDSQLLCEVPLCTLQIYQGRGGLVTRVSLVDGDDKVIVTKGFPASVLTANLQHDTVTSNGAS